MSFWCGFTYVLLFTLTVCVDGTSIKILKSDNPGRCTKSNNGQMLYVRDRQNKYKLLVCSKDQNGYSWKTIDGSTPTGEFFSPGYDCSAILDGNPKAKDGFYWVNFNNKTPKKVWCDMSTDGGGFMLIARKVNPTLLSVPSSNKPVAPFGSPHWSSALGSAPIVDFRVQVAIADDFKKTKAHWFYRLKSPRKLRNLLTMNQGCTSRAPGIGNVAFVKDLLSQQIATKNFRCSKFGTPHHPTTGFGWSKLNSCLRQPCAKGFGYGVIGKQLARTSLSGAFSYSATNSISGINYDATAFVGCDFGHCCTCYGKYGGKKDYCVKQCHAKNGGTVSKKAFIWFWVRSSLPQRAWSECMEYNVTENGVTVWYKFRGAGDIPVKGRCAMDKPLFYDGMIVVRDKSAIKKVPSIEGMIVYRKDNQRLYVNDDKSLEPMAQEKEVVHNHEYIAKLNKTLYDYLHRKIRNGDLFEFMPSVSLMGRQSYLKLLKQWLPAQTAWQLCYRASQDGWASSRFHQRCDYKGQTVTIIRVGPYVFGGYTDQSWGGSGRYIRSTKSFIFSFKNKYNVKPFTAPIYRYSQYAFYTNNGYGPTFGGGHDIYIASNAYSSSNSYSNFGNTYKAPSGYSYGGSNTKALLAGSYKFTPSEVEVFYRR